MPAHEYNMSSGPHSKAVLHDKTILIIDDSSMMRQILYSALKAFGVGCIISTEQPKTAIAKLLSQDIDAIVVDWKMMPVHGIDLVKHIRWKLKDPKRRVPILMCSGYTEMSRILEARDSGISDFLCKPVKPADLYDKLCRAIFEPQEFIVSDTYIGPKWAGQSPLDIEFESSDDSNVINLEAL